MPNIIYSQEQEKITPKIIKSVKLDYDRSHPRQVYAAVLEVYQTDTVKNLEAANIAAFIPEGADPGTWIKNLRNVEHNINNPKPKKSSKSRSSKRKNNFGRLFLAQEGE